MEGGSSETLIRLLLLEIPCDERESECRLAGRYVQLEFVRTLGVSVHNLQ